nr:hypothetical protein GCM10020093_034000 [Planobispora longispora]
MRVLPPDLDLAGLGRLLAQSGPYGFVKMTPGHLEAMLSSLPGAVPEAAHLVVGGEALRASLAARWPDAGGRARIVNEYGPTETTVACTAHIAGGGIPAPGTRPAGPSPPGRRPPGRPRRRASRPDGRSRERPCTSSIPGSTPARRARRARS